MRDVASWGVNFDFSCPALDQSNPKSSGAKLVVMMRVLALVPVLLLVLVMAMVIMIMMMKMLLMMKMMMLMTTTTNPEFQEFRRR